MKGILAKEIGKKGSDRYYCVKCPDCKKERWVTVRYTTRKGYTKLCRSCCSKNRHGENHPQWQGGRKIHKGYVYIYAREHPLADIKGYVLEHRLIAAEEWGINAIKGKHIHHKDGNRQNNNIKNLEILTTSKHSILHNKNPNSTMRHKGQPNPEIKCACGCGEKRFKYDKKNRLREFIWGHQKRDNLGRFYWG